MINSKDTTRKKNRSPDHLLKTFCAEPRKEKRPAWKGDDSLCADGRSCEFFLMCWMSAGLLDGSCGGIMYACCHRTKDAAKASNDYNLVDEPRDQIQSLATDSYVAEATSEDQCGISASKQTAQRRIVGGDEAGFGSFPWQAYIRIGSSRCGGTLVNRFHVVTAGHCVAKASARQVQVTLGDYVVNSATESLPAYTFGVREIRVHPYFKFTPQADRFDVAVLRLDRPVHYMPHIAPICLPEKNEDFLGQYGWAAGWGALQAGSRLRPKTLQAVDVPVIDNRVCERWHRTNGINVVIYDEMMCAGYRGGGKDSCQGDSGGPLMLEKTGKWYLIGIVSAGYSCAQPGQPGIYHRVAKTVDWITYVINS
ncbi:serine proteinase stubble isoform X2 [Nasonia vitripennis]|uniref:Peptidase S1 domain-containing protein n=1 Tax=Nasonia vitripennis TaxID=7425 RepID=A0A7M7Q4G7_NASVI|nr:serine proteinase stubble isoform X2 [Nasonia vitripennis]